MEIYPVLQNYKPWVKILAFLVIILISLLFTSLLGLLIGTAIFGPELAESIPKIRELSDPTTLAQLKYFQIVNQFGIFIFPSLIFIYLVTDDRLNYIRIKNKIHFVAGITVVSLMLIALPFINWLAEINLKMSLPSSLESVEKWMRDTEYSASQLTAGFLASTSVGGFLINIFMIAVIPAIGEEVVFRGIFQRLFFDWTKNIHAAVFMAAFLFSFIHLQFYGFLPRFLIGVLFGYLFYWSGSIWMPVLAHFVNNISAVVVAFLSAKGICDINFEDFGKSDNPFVIVMSALSVSALVFFLWMRRKKFLLPSQADSQSPDLHSGSNIN